MVVAEDSGLSSALGANLFSFMNIAICATENSQLEDYVPFPGTWRLMDDRDKYNVFDIEQAIIQWLNVYYPVSVEIFDEGGRQINGDLPWEGTFLAVRESC